MRTRRILAIPLFLFLISSLHNVTAESTREEARDELSFASLFPPGSSTLRIKPFETGLASGVAVLNGNFYVLVNDFNGITDAIFRVNRETGKTEAIRGIGKLRAAGITTDGENLWILSRSTKNFLRMLDPSCKAVKIIGIDSLPKGKLSGLGFIKGTLYFLAGSLNKTKLMAYNLKEKKIHTLSLYPEVFQSLVSSGNILYAYRNRQESYSRHWLFLFSPTGKIQKKMRFINTRPDALTADDHGLIMLRTRQNMLELSRLIVLKKRNLIAGLPKTRKVVLRYSREGKKKSGETEDLLVPFPCDRSFQSVKRIALDPEPDTFLVDSWGNRWASFSSSKKNSGTITLAFDLSSCEVAYTLDPEKKFVAAAANNIPADFTRETCLFDLSDFVVKSHASRIRTFSSLWKSIFAIRDYTYSAISLNTEASDLRASPYLYKGRGPGFGMAIAFVALCRRLGYPARIAGGIFLGGKDRSADFFDNPAWPQIFLPGAGWVDFTLSPYMDPGKKSPDETGFRDSRVFLTFEGDINCPDYPEKVQSFSLYALVASEQGKDLPMAKFYPGKVTILSTNTEKAEINPDK